MNNKNTSPTVADGRFQKRSFELTIASWIAINYKMERIAKRALTSTCYFFIFSPLFVKKTQRNIHLARIKKCEIFDYTVEQSSDT